MATTKKSIKTTGKKKGGKRYMKKAARRTLAALLMITALIVAAIPATPSSAHNGGKDVDDIKNLSDTVSYNAPDGKTRFYFKRIQNPPIDDTLTFIGVAFLDSDGNELSDSEIAGLTTAVNFGATIPIATVKPTGEVDPETGEIITIIVYEELACTAVGEDIVNYDHITTFACPSVEKIFAGFSGINEDEPNDTLTQINCPNATEIGDNAFLYCTSLRNCIISNTDPIKRIGSNAFSHTALSSFPEASSIEYIGDSAFSYTQLNDITIPGPTEGQTCALFDSIFKGCSDLRKVTFTGRFGSLGAHTFENCSELRDVTLVDTMQSIGDGAFEGCTKLQALTIPGKVGALKDSLLSQCKQLEKLTLCNDSWKNDEHQDVNLSGVFDMNWIKGNDPDYPCNLVVEGYRYYINNADNKKKSEAYTFCINNKIPYKCLDEDAGWADQYFDIDGSGKLLYIDVENYFDEQDGGFSTDKHIDIPSTVHGETVTGIGSEAFKDANKHIIKTISVVPSNIMIEPKAFNTTGLSGLTYVKFAPGSTIIIDDNDNDGSVFPSSSSFYIYGDIAKDSTDSLNAFEYAMKYNIEYRGDGKYEDGYSGITLVVNPVPANDTGKATLVGAVAQGEPAPASDYVDYKKKWSDLGDDGDAVYLQPGISAIDKDFFKSSSKLEKFRSAGLTEIKDKQFEACQYINDIDIGGNFTEGSFGNLPFQSAGVDNISISDGRGVYSVDDKGVIYEQGSGGKTIVESIERSSYDNSDKKAINGNGGVTYVPKSDVIGMRDSAFEGNQWLRTFSTVYEHNGGNLSNIDTIPVRAFYNASELAIVTLGSTGGKGYVEANAFNYDSTHPMHNDSMQVTVLNDRMQYDTTAFADDEFIYNFYSKQGDDTYDICDREKDLHKNLIWHDIGEAISKSLADYELYFPKAGGVYKYTGEPYTFVKGGKDYDKTGADIVVRSKDDGSVLDPENYIVTSPSKSQTGIKGGDLEVPVIIIGNVEKGYSETPALSDSIWIKDEGGGGGITPSGRFDVTWKYNGPTRSGATVYNPNNEFQYWNEGVPGVEKVFDTKYKKEVVPQGSDSISSNHYFITKYGLVSPGLGDNTGYGYFHIKDAGGEEHWEEIPYNIRKDIGTNTAPDGSKSIIIGTKESGISGNSIYAKFILKDKGVTLNEGEEYEVGMIERVSDKKGRARLFGLSPKYTGTYVYEFPIPVDPSSSSSSHGGSSTTTSSSSGGGTSSSSSSSGSSSSSSKSSSSKSSSKGGSSSSSRSSSGSSSSSGSGNKNSGTTIVNRNYYGKNGGTADELEEMLRAAHIDSINGGTADGYQVNITKSDAAEASFREALLRRYGSLDNIRYFSMDIDVKDENGNDIDTTGMTVTLTLPLPSSMEQYGTNNQVATVDSAGDLEDLNVQFSTLEGRPCATFVCPHFSPYGFYVNTSDLAIGTLDNTPKTGDPIPLKWFVSFGLAAFSIFLFLKKDPKPQANPA